MTPEDKLCANVARRCLAIRLINGRNIRQFGIFLGLGENQWDNIERNGRVTIKVARILKKATPGLTYDYLYDGDDKAMPRQLARRLRELEAA